MQQLTRRRYTVLAIVTIAVSLLLSLAVAEMVLRWVQPSNTGGGRLDDGLFSYDPVIGWTLSRDWRGRHEHHDYSVDYSVNGLGYRGKPVDGRGQAGTKRYVYLGDSFTFGMGVDDDQTFAEVLNRAGNGAGIHINFGVPGYSTDQELLLAEDRLERVKPDVVVLVTYLANDLLDNPRPYPLQTDFAKPYFSLDNGSLELQNTPVPKQPKPATLRTQTLASSLLDGVALPSTGLLSQSELLRRLGYQPSYQNIGAVLSERTGRSIELYLALVDRLDGVVRAMDSKLVVALLPGGSFTREPDSYSAQYQDYVRQQLAESLLGRGIILIDLGPKLRQRYSSDQTVLYYPYDGHLTSSGHQLVAEIFLGQLP